MNKSTDLRATKRIPVRNRIRVLAHGRMIAYALAINLSMGGVLLKAMPPVPVGSVCDLAFLAPNGTSGVVSGMVVRSDSASTALQFFNTLEADKFEALITSPTLSLAQSVFVAYKSYFQASQSKHDADYQSLLGITREEFKKIFSTTFALSILAALLSVWAFRSLLSPFSNLTKIIGSFGYVAVWLMAIQPTLDLAVIRVVRKRALEGPHR
jgi:hypothetical protein